ncbi:unnamed protein product, partial [Heterotrigona itama]
YLPYKEIPRARYFQDVGLDIDYSLKSLDRRPRSPIRLVLLFCYIFNLTNSKKTNTVQA